MGTPAQTRMTLVTGTSSDAPAEPVPVAVLARTSTLALQDPVASLNRQIRSCQAWLPPGWYVAGYYWDVESGGLDLEARSQGQAWQPFAAAGIPRDGGMADLLTEAKAPLPRFAAVVCEDIERSARDTFNALKLEKELSREGIPLFATDEPASIEGINATTVLVRRVKQGVAEWFRLQLKEKAWKGLQEHSLAGWNIGTPPYGYLADRIPHPAPAKAAQGRTKSRLIPDPGRAPVVGQIYTWRAVHQAVRPGHHRPAERRPRRLPHPGRQTRLDRAGVATILANPKYTGHMVYGRTRTTGTGRARPVPPDQWIWTPQPTHPAIIDRPTWDAAQKIGAQRGNVRDPETPAARPGRRYILRSRIRQTPASGACAALAHLQHRPRHIYYAAPTTGQPPPRRRPPRPRHGRPQRNALMAALGSSSTSTSSATTAPHCSPPSSPPPAPSTPKPRPASSPTSTPSSVSGVEVPPVLLSGDHAKIAAWRREQSRARTAARRKDLLEDGGP